MNSRGLDCRIGRLVAGAVLALVTSVAMAQTRFVTEPSPPFNYLENGEVTGPAHAIIGAICADLGTDCSFELTKWDRAIGMARDGEVNGIFSVGKNTERLEWMHFSSPILATAYGLYVLDDNPLEFRQPADLAGYTVVTYGPSNTSQSLETLGDAVPDMEIVVESKLRLILRKFDAGRYEGRAALYLNKDVVASLIDELGLEKLRYAGDHRQILYYVGFPKAATEQGFVDRFNGVLDRFKQDGTLATLLEPYGMTPAN